MRPSCMHTSSYLNLLSSSPSYIIFFLFCSHIPRPLMICAKEPPPPSLKFGRTKRENRLRTGKKGTVYYRLGQRRDYTTFGILGVIGYKDRVPANPIGNDFAAIVPEGGRRAGLKLLDKEEEYACSFR